MDPITNPEDVCYYSRGTRWCTTRASTAKSYLTSGPIYIVFEKVGEGILKKIAQRTADYSQVMNVHDRPLEMDPQRQEAIEPDPDDLLSTVHWANRNQERLPPDVEQKILETGGKPLAAYAYRHGLPGFMEKIFDM